jgi:hypothetical protein
MQKTTSNSCPLESSLDWLTMLEQLGETGAWQYWTKYRDYPETLAKTKDLESDLMIEPEMTASNILNLKNRLRRYNHQYNTAHSIVTTKTKGLDRYKVNFSVSYFPINLELQRKDHSLSLGLTEDLNSLGSSEFVVNQSTLKNLTGTLFKKELFDNQLIDLRSKISKLNNNNAKAGINQVYKIEDIKQIGQSTQFTYKVVKYPGKLNIEEKLQRSRNNDTANNLNLSNKTNQLNDLNNQLSLFQKEGVNAILPTDKIIWGHPTIGKSYLKEKGYNNFITLDDDYASEVNNFIDSHKNSSETRQQYKGKKPKEYNEFMLDLFDRLKTIANKEGKRLFVSNTNILKERMSEFDKVITIPKDEFKKRFDARGATYGFEDWKSDIDHTIAKVSTDKVINTSGYLADLLQKEAIITKGVPELFESNSQLNNIGTPEQYSQYLNTIFPDSKVKDIVYHGTAEEINDKFDPSFIAGAKKSKNKLDNVGVYVTPMKEYAEKYAQKVIGDNVIKGKVLSLLINANNIERAKDSRFEDLSKELKNELYPNADTIYGEHLEFQKDEYGVLPKIHKNLYKAPEYVVFESEQIHILGSSKDLKGFENYVNSQPKEQKFSIKNETQYFSSKTVSPLVLNTIANKLKELGIPVSVKSSADLKEKFNEQHSKTSAFLRNNIIYLNSDKATLDSPMHEYAGHIFLNYLKNNEPENFKKVIELSLQADIKNQISRLYPELTNPTDLGEEIFSTLIGLENQDKLMPKDSSLIQSILNLFKNNYMFKVLNDIFKKVFNIDYDVEINYNTSLSEIMNQVSSDLFNNDSSLFKNVNQYVKDNIKNSLTDTHSQEEFEQELIDMGLIQKVCKI